MSGGLARNTEQTGADCIRQAGVSVGLNRSACSAMYGLEVLERHRQRHSVTGSRSGLTSLHGLRFGTELEASQLKGAQAAIKLVDTS